MNVIHFILSYWDSILLLLAVVVGAIFALRHGMKTQVYAILKYLVTQAEAEYGDGTGVLKKQAVTAWIYEKMPSVFRYFLTEETISNLIEKAWAWMVELIDDNAAVSAVLTDDTAATTTTDTATTTNSTAATATETTADTAVVSAVPTVDASEITAEAIADDATANNA